MEEPSLDDLVDDFWRGNIPIESFRKKDMWETFRRIPYYCQIQGCTKSPVEAIVINEDIYFLCYEHSMDYFGYKEKKFLLQELKMIEQIYLWHADIYEDEDGDFWERFDAE